MVFCPECGSENPDYAIYCQECGEVIINFIHSHEKPELIEKILTAKLEDEEDVHKIMATILTTNIMENYNFDDKAEFAKEMNEIMEHNRKAPQTEKIMPDATVIRLSKYLNGNIELTETIERTETMRASNLGSWTQAKNEGAKYFVVDNRAEACNYCMKIVRDKCGVFDIDDTAYLPPFHPNCACVPHYFSDEELAQESADEIESDNLKRRRDLLDKGYTLPDDGSGPLAPGVTLESYKDSKRRYYAYKTVEQQNEIDYNATGYEAFFYAQKNLNLNVIPLLERAIEDNISVKTKAKSHRMMGEIYYKNGDNELAVEHFEKALSYNPKVGVKRLYDKLKKNI